ncbi:MAG: hypothetical protein KAX38_02100 [Candidatus Krumholzibacteria bacterium]|nr:hypothetical protein [Candidatus Krumholzibacteria bacterium]
MGAGTKVRNRSYPSYLDLFESGEFTRRLSHSLLMIQSCRLCPRRCSINRLDGEKGACGVGRHAIVSSVNVHFGE